MLRNIYGEQYSTEFKLQKQSRLKKKHDLLVQNNETLCSIVIIIVIVPKQVKGGRIRIKEDLYKLDDWHKLLIERNDQKRGWTI